MKKTLDFFRDLNHIPRESGNEQKVCKYLCEFAQKRNLHYYTDNHNNVIIIKTIPNIEPIILQAHTDMVCEKDNIVFDFKNDKIETYIDNGFIKTKGTTLGADNGIGIAQILNLLENENLSIEAIFTACEETSMDGAMNIDVSMLKGKKMINLDGFEENVIITESAAFFDIVVDFDYQFNTKLINYSITLTGLAGGHSGFEIDKNHGNAITLLSDFLINLNDISIASFNGGTKFNVIPSNCTCTFYSDFSFKQINEKITLFISNCNYSNLHIELKKIDEETLALSNVDSLDYLNFVSKFPHGVMFKHENNPTTSVNLGIADLNDKKFMIGMRSSRKDEENIVLNRLKEYCNAYSYVFNIISSQPGFQSNLDGELIKNLLKNSPYDIGTTKCKSVHITVESGFFKEKMSDLEIAIISPNIQNAHSFNECVEINSIEKTDLWLLNFISSTQNINN